MTCRAYQAALWISAGLAFVLTLPPARADDDSQANEALWLADHAKLVHKVKTLVIDNVDLKDASIDQVVDYLRHQTKLSDPDHQGINFVYSNQPALKTFKFNAKLKNTTVENVLKHFPLIGYSAGDFIVELRIDNGEGLSFRTFSVPDNLLGIKPSMLIDKNKQTYDVRPLFRAKGIKFPPGASAIYTLPTKTLTVVFSDPEEIIRVDEILVYGFKSVK